MTDKGSEINEFSLYFTYFSKGNNFFLWMCHSGLGMGKISVLDRAEHNQSDHAGLEI